MSEEINYDNFDVKKAVMQAFGDGTIPVGGKIMKLKSTEFDLIQSDKYEDVQKLLEDERIYSIIALIAALVQESYKGVHLRPKDRYTDDELDDNELKILKAADLFVGEEEGLDYSQLFFEIAWNVILHGEERFIYIFDSDKKKIIELRSVPLNSSYFVDDKSQIKNIDKIVYSDKILVVNTENNNNTDSAAGKSTNISPLGNVSSLIAKDKPAANTSIDAKTYTDKQFEHIAYHKRGVWRKDIHDRQTFGVYSVVPGKSLQNLFKWKLKTMENDIVWKNKLMPRLKHVLNMAGIFASKYPGKTPSEKTAAALKDAKTVILAFKQNIKIDSPDEDIITSDSVTTEVLEPTSASYLDPNNTLKQINESFNTPFGVPNGQLGGNSGTSMGSQLDSVFESIRVGTISKVIAKHLAKAVRKQLILDTPTLKDVINRIYIHTDTTLPVHKEELARALLALAKSGMVTKQEGRVMIKLPRLPQLPDDAFLAAKDNSRESEAQVEKDLLSKKGGGDTNNEGPGAAINKGASQR